ncbi:hypothetical protein D3C81_1538980 [compost metagenome]
MDAQTHFGVFTQLGLHLTLVDLTVWPMLLAFRHTSTGHPDQACCFGDLVAVFFIGSPIGAQGQRHTVAVLTIDQHILVHQKVNEG